MYKETINFPRISYLGINNEFPMQPFVWLTHKEFTNNKEDRMRLWGVGLVCTMLISVNYTAAFKVSLFQKERTICCSEVSETFFEGFADLKHTSIVLHIQCTYIDE